MYPRESSLDLFEAEARASEFAGVEPNQLFLSNTGMSAVTDALDVAFDASQGGRNAQRLTYSSQPFKATKYFIEGPVKNSGVWVQDFDAADPDDVENLIQHRKPTVIFAETVGNGVRVPLLNIEGFLESAAKYAPEATIVLDNTLPLSTAAPLSEKITEEDRVIIVESGTKAYTLNQSFAGITYSKNPELLEEIRQYRCNRGSGLIGANIDSFQDFLPESRQAFDDRNKRLFASAATIALYLYEAQEEGADFTVAHPSLQSHPNYEYGQQQYPDGASPVLFLSCHEGTDKDDLNERLQSDPEVAQHLDLRQSFGFDRSCIVSADASNAVRITGGAKVDSHALGQALKEAALRK